MAILLVAGLVRLPGLIADPVVTVDESRYLRLAAAAPEHPEVLLLHAYHPAYPALLVPVVAMAPESPERPARLLSALLGLLAILCCWGMTRERFGEGAALMAAALFALFPGPVEAGSNILSESLYVPALLGSCWALLRMLRSGGFASAAAFGGLAGLAYLTRPEGLAPAVVGIGWLAVGGAVRAGEGKVAVAHRFGLLATAAVSLLLLAGPYMHAIGGLTRKKATGVQALDPDRGVQEASHALELISASWVGSSDVPSSERAPLAEFTHEWFSSPSPVFWLIALVAAVAAVRRRLRPTAADYVVAGVIALFIAAHVLLLSRAGYLSSRHVWPVACLALPWLAAAMSRAWGWRPEARPWAGRAGAGAAIAVLAVFALVSAARPWTTGRSYLRDAGVFLRGHGATGPEIGVLSTDTRVAYYSRSRPLIIGRTNWDDLLRLGFDQGARFIACDEADLADRVIGFDPAAPSGVRLVQALPISSRRGRPAGRFLVYEILAPK